MEIQAPQDGLGAKASQKLLEKLDRWLASNDRDSNAEVEGTGRHKAGIGIYFFTEQLDDEVAAETPPEARKREIHSEEE